MTGASLYESDWSSSSPGTVRLKLLPQMITDSQSPKAAGRVDVADLAQMDQGVTWSEGLERLHLLHKSFIFKHFVAGVAFQVLLFCCVYASIWIQSMSTDRSSGTPTTNAETLVILFLTAVGAIQLKTFGRHKKIAFSVLPGLSATDSELRRAFNDADKVRIWMHAFPGVLLHGYHRLCVGAEWRRQHYSRGAC